MKNCYSRTPLKKIFTIIFITQIFLFFLSLEVSADNLKKANKTVEQMLIQAKQHATNTVNLDPKKKLGPFSKTIGKYFPEVTWELAEKVDNFMMKGKKVDRLSFPFPFPYPCDFESSNNYLTKEISKGINSHGLSCKTKL